MTRSHINNFLLVLSGAILLAAANFSLAQSPDQNFPTPITSNEINGTIKARDIGDPRLTRHFYAFDGGQGDIFINVVTKNFSGDIDVFAVDGLRPLTKMIIYGDSGISETGRLVYMRKGERLLLRVEGRPPDDDPATYRIKFGGSFIALSRTKEDAAPTVKGSETDESGEIKVNSVGTIVAVTPKPKPPKAVPIATPEPKETETTSKVETEPEPKKTEVLVTKPPVLSKEPSLKKAAEDTSASAAGKKPASTTRTTRPPRTPPPAKATTVPTKTAKVEEPPVEKKADPLASIRLIVQLKSGVVIEHPMSEVVRFGVEAGMLTVVTKDGKVSRFSILAVAKTTIE